LDDDEESLAGMNAGRWKLDAGCSTIDAQGCSNNKSTISRRAFDALRPLAYGTSAVQWLSSLRGHTVCDSSVLRQRNKANHPETTMLSTLNSGILQLVNSLAID
jgi:hypothetical protein